MAIVTVTGGKVDVTAEQNAYAPRGAALDAFYSRDDELLMSGPARTGKSRALLEKLHLCACKYAGMRGLIVRKTRTSLTDSGLVTFEDDVLPARSSLKLGPRRRYRHEYTYPNGSVIVIAGMDNPTKVMSTEYDLIYVQEATELTEEDWELLSSRLSRGVMPYQPLIADCNPGSPQHWLKKRAERGVTRILESRHEDNPVFWDIRANDWTERGRRYVLSKLENLTGVRKLRLRHGIWAMSEGMVYGDVWEPAHHLIYRFAVPRHWLRFWVVDFGFTNPFCWQCWAQDGDGRLYRIAEIYQTKTLVEDHAKSILKWQAAHKEPNPVAVICDWDAEDRATLERYLGLSTTAAYKAVSDGIQHVAGRLRKADDGRARIFFLRDSLLEVDEDLREAKKPTCTEEEVEGYVWATNAAGVKEEPVKRDDHGMDATRYAVCYVDTQYSEGVF